MADFYSNLFTEFRAQPKKERKIAPSPAILDWCSAGEIRRIAIFRALQLGDLLCAAPAVRALRAFFPAAALTLIGLPWAHEFCLRFSSYIDDFAVFPGYPGLPERTPDVRALPMFLSEMRRRRYDLVLQMHGSGEIVNPLTLKFGARFTAGFYPAGGQCADARLFLPYPDGIPEIHRLLALISRLGIPLQGDHLEFPLKASDFDECRRLTGNSGFKKNAYVCIHPGSQLPSRRWPVDRFRAVASALAKDGWQIAVTGTAAESGLSRAVAAGMDGAVDFAGRTSLGGLAALLAGSRLLISNDTGLSHIAAALRVPSVIVANGSDPARWAPLDRRRHRVVFHPVDCRPCMHPVCPIGHPCAEGVSVETVLSEARSLLNGRFS